MTIQATASSLFTDLKARIDARQAKIGIIGLGYVGLPLALLYSEQKFPVTGFDIDQRKVDTLDNGGTYIVRITPEEIAAAKANGFKATADYSRITAMDAIIICVPTPLNEYHEPDLSYITDTAHAVAPHLRAGQIVILESTTYPGTTEEVLVPILEKENKAGLKVSRKGTAADNEFWVAFSPEREDPGNTEVARHDIPKVIGGVDPQASEIAAALLRLHLPPHRSGLVARRRGDDQVAREYLPLRQHRAGQRTQDALPAHGARHLGDHRRRCHQALRLPSVLSRAGSRRTLHSGRSRSIFHGRRRNSTSAPASSNWPAKSTWPCPTT